MSRTGFQYALAALGAATVEGADLGILRSIHAGLNAAAQTGRELSDLEQLALDNLMGQLAPEGEEPSSGDDTEHSLAQPPLSSDGAEGGASAPQGEVTQPGAEAPVSAPSAPSAGEEALNRASAFAAQNPLEMRHYDQSAEGPQVASISTSDGTQRPLEHVVEAQEPVDLGLTETVTSPPFQPQEEDQAEHVDDSDGA